MPSVIYRTQNGVKYAYESRSYWDPVKKAPRTKRTYLGKVDPETGEIVRVYKKADKSVKPTSQADDTVGSMPSETLLADFEALKEEVRQLREQNDSLKAKFMALKEILDSVS